MNHNPWDDVPSQPGDNYPYFVPASGQSWPAPQPVAPVEQPQLKQPQPKPARARSLPSLVAVAVLAAGVGGGAAIGADRYLGNTTSVSPAPSTTVTKVVQGNASAPDWTLTAQAASKSTVAIQVSSAQGSGSGSGVVLDANGSIVTNNHVVAGAGSNASIIVQIGDRQYGAAIVGTDPTSDLAVLKLDNPGEGLVPMPFANSDKVAVGDPVMAIGNPLGLSGTVTTGIVSALNRPVLTSDGATKVVTNAIQTSAAINPGNSGGALVNANGELIGINSAIASLGASSQGSQSGNIGIGFAIESNLVKNVAEQIIKTGSATHAWLGVSAQDAAAKVSDGTILGAQVTQVQPDSPAAKAGIKVGDVITSVNNKPVVSLESLVAIVRAQPVGGQADIVLVRATQQQKITATLAPAPR